MWTPTDRTNRRTVSSGDYQRKVTSHWKTYDNLCTCIQFINNKFNLADLFVLCCYRSYFECRLVGIGEPSRRLRNQIGSVAFLTENPSTKTWSIIIHNDVARGEHLRKMFPKLTEPYRFWESSSSSSTWTIVGRSEGSRNRSGM